MTIHKLLTSPEGKTLEFKRDTSALKKIMKTIVSFANSAGGTVIIGQEDNGDVVGVDDPLSSSEIASALGYKKMSGNFVRHCYATTGRHMIGNPRIK